MVGSYLPNREPTNQLENHPQISEVRVRIRDGPTNLATFFRQPIQFVYFVKNSLSVPLVIKSACTYPCLCSALFKDLQYIEGDNNDCPDRAKQTVSDVIELTPASLVTVRDNLLITTPNTIISYT